MAKLKANRTEATLRLTRPLRRDVDALKKRMRAVEKQQKDLLKAVHALAEDVGECVVFSGGPVK